MSSLSSALQDASRGTSRETLEMSALRSSRGQHCGRRGNVTWSSGDGTSGSDAKLSRGGLVLGGRLSIGGSWSVATPVHRHHSN